MIVRIYKPAKSTMQSGRGGRMDLWVLEPERGTPRRPEPLMGWSSAADTLNELRLTFPTAEEAVAFARKKGWDYRLSDAHERKVRPRNYADNFRYTPPADDE